MKLLLSIILMFVAACGQTKPQTQQCADSPILGDKYDCDFKILDSTEVGHDGR